jgi:hypothetical protein
MRQSLVVKNVVECMNVWIEASSFHEVLSSLTTW